MERGAQPGNGNAKKGAEWRQAIKRPLNQPGITISHGRFRLTSGRLGFLHSLATLARTPV